MLSFDTADQFLQRLLVCFYEDMRISQPDNYDWRRFSSDGVDRSDIPYTDLHIDAMLALTRHTEAFYRAFSLLQDDCSRRIYWDLLRYRLAGHKHVRLSRNDASYEKSMQAGLAHPSQEAGPCLYMGKPSVLRLYEISFAGQALSFKAFQVVWPYYIPQYYFDRDATKIKPVTGDHVIDAGASLGDTSLAFAASVGPTGCVYAFEVLPSQLELCQENLHRNSNVSRFKLFPYGLSNRLQDGVGTAAQDPRGCDFGFEIKEDDTQFALTTIDHLVDAGEIERVDFIKMDIEGSELRALQGAEKTLRRFKPKLAISIYHKVEDFYEIPLYLDWLNLGYRFYVEHYTIHVGETVLYATVAET